MSHSDPRPRNRAGVGTPTDHRPERTPTMMIAPPVTNIPDPRTPTPTRAAPRGELCCGTSTLNCELCCGTTTFTAGACFFWAQPGPTDVAD